MNGSILLVLQKRWIAWLRPHPRGNPALSLVFYELSTDYRGQISINVDVDCEVELDYKKRDGWSGSDSESRSDDHNLYAQGNESATTSLDF